MGLQFPTAKRLQSKQGGHTVKLLLYIRKYVNMKQVKIKSTPTYLNVCYQAQLQLRKFSAVGLQRTCQRHPPTSCQSHLNWPCSASSLHYRGKDGQINVLLKQNLHLIKRPEVYLHANKQIFHKITPQLLLFYNKINHKSSGACPLPLCFILL